MNQYMEKKEKMIISGNGQISLIIYQSFLEKNINFHIGYIERKHYKTQYNRKKYLLRLKVFHKKNFRIIWT